MSIQIKRIYEPPAPTDGRRILVDRLWPRGVSKQRAALDAWDQDIAPSPALRQWFGHDPAHMQAFAARYRQELDADPAKQLAVQKLLALAREGPVTLLYAAHDPQVNHARVLQAYLAQKTAP